MNLRNIFEGVGISTPTNVLSHSNVFLSQSRREEEVPQRWFCDKQSPSMLQGWITAAAVMWHINAFEGIARKPQWN